MSLHFSKLLQWIPTTWDQIHKELEAPFNEPIFTDGFTRENLEFEYDAVIDRALRYSVAAGVKCTEKSSEEADLFFNRYVDPARTIVVVAGDNPPKPEMAGLLLHTLRDIPIHYRFAIDAPGAFVIIYSDGRALRAFEEKKGKAWLNTLARLP